LTPVYNTNPVFLRECVDSVLSQAYQNWELCLVDDKSSREDTINALKEIATLDDRIKVIFRETNGHICQATNDALKISTGDRICFLDHDDTLAQHALQSLAEILSLNPGLSLIYSDEDFLDLCGNRISPHFKSDWNRHLLYSHNYITHFVCVDSELVRSLGGLREGTEGAQDYDFLLRLSGVVNDNEVYHIPEILYHWRISETSTASSTKAKPYTVNAGKKALNDFLESKFGYSEKITKRKTPYSETPAD
jgi:glycosyltransferase involved in cell wall biosynthesis